MHGCFDVAYRLVCGLKRALNTKEKFSRRIRNKRNIGKTAAP
jgi:hypothetical protein